MKNIVKEESGITLIALVITIIVLVIITGVGIGQLAGKKNSIKESKDTTITSELSKVQQVVIEIYLKYIQLGNKIVLKGTPMTYEDARNEFSKLRTSDSLKVIYGIDETDPSLFYYKVGAGDLKEMGLENIHRKDEYIINYSSGEVFNISQKRISNGDALYIYAKKIGYDYIKSGLILYLDGEDNTGNGHDGSSNIWKDLSGNGNDGTLNNFNNDNTSGWGENCINFDSIDDKISIPESTTTNPVEQTIEVVLKCNGESLNSADGRQIFFVKWRGYTMEINPGRTISYGRTDGYLRTNNEINYGKIYNITSKHGNNISKIYLNNVYENQQNISPCEYTIGKKLTIGCWENSGRFFNGSIYVIRMYNRALTDEEIAHNYSIDKARFGIED